MSHSFEDQLGLPRVPSHQPTSQRVQSQPRQRAQTSNFRRRKQSQYEIAPSMGAYFQALEQQNLDYNADLNRVKIHREMNLTARQETPNDRSNLPCQQLSFYRSYCTYTCKNHQNIASRH